MAKDYTKQGLYEVTPIVPGIVRNLLKTIYYLRIPRQDSDNRQKQSREGQTVPLPPGVDVQLDWRDFDVVSDLLKQLDRDGIVKIIQYPSQLSQLSVEQDGVLVADPATLINFHGNVTVAQEGSGAVGVTVNNAVPQAGNWTSIGSAFTIAADVANVVRVQKDPKTGDFSSIAAALASITTASSLNPFLISVGPGVYVEPQIVMKPFVSIQGSGSLSTTTVVAADPNNHLFVGAENDFIRDLSITGVTGAGKAAIYAEIGVLVDNVYFFNNNIHILAHATTTAVTLFAIGCFFSGPFDQAIVVSNSPPATTRCLVFVKDGLVVANPSPPFTCVVNVTGTNCTAMTSSLIGSIQGSGGGTCFYVADGGALSATDGQILNFDTALHVDNVGAAPSAKIAAGVLQSLTWDLRIDHPGAMGSFTGDASQAKVFVDPSNTGFLLNLVDFQRGNLVISGDLTARQTDGVFTDVTTLVTESSTMGLLEGGTLSDGGGLVVNIEQGFGYLEIEPEILRKYEWPDTALPLLPSAENHIYVNPSGLFVADGAPPDSHLIIYLGRVITDASGIEFIDESPLNAEHVGNTLDTFNREALGPVYASGSLVSENGTRQLDVGSGIYYLSMNRKSPSGGTPISWTAYYRDGSGGFTRAVQDVVDNAFYDDGTGTLAPLSPAFYAKHSLYLVGDGANERYMLVYGQAQFSAIAVAEQAELPLPPTYFDEGVVLIASLIVQQGAANLVQTRDERPVVGFKSSGISATTFHGNLLGLGNDDHKQYLLVSGARPMTGVLDMGGNSITGINLVDGVVVHAHAARHLPNGADPLATAAPLANLSATTTNSVGVQNALARSDHGHAILTGSPVDVGTANAAGTSAALALADHVHMGLRSLAVFGGTQEFGDVSLIAGTGISITDATGTFTIANTGVTSVALADGSTAPIYGVSGSPVTTTGALTLTLLSQNANTVFAGPASGSAAQPAFRSLVPGDVPSLDASKITTGVLPVARGGTNSGAALLGNQVMYSSGSGAIVELGAMTNGQLIVGSTGAAPVISTLTSGTGISVTNGPGSITIANTGVTSVALTMPSIFSVSGSPITTTGTLAVSLANASANTVLAGPGSGVPAAPAFRSLVLADLPHLTNGQIYVGSTGNAVAAATLTAGTGVSITNGAGSITISSTATGTVTSVGLSLPASVFTVSGSPVTTSGTLTASYNTQGANTVFAGPTSGAATPTFRKLSFADLPQLTSGQIYIGATGSSVVPATITGGTNVTVTTGSGSITIAASNAPSISGTSAGSSTTTTATSATYVPISGLSVTPAAGKYFVWASCGFQGNSGSDISIAIFAGGVQTAYSERISTGPAGSHSFAMATNDIVTVDGTQAVTLQWRSASTMTALQRTINLMPVN